MVKSPSLCCRRGRSGSAVQYRPTAEDRLAKRPQSTSVSRSECGPALLAISALRRSRDDRWLGGVCGGIARVTGVEGWIWRLIFATLALCAGTGVLIYLLMWILIPPQPRILGLAPGHPQAG
jgi:phage shock protein PspC (stress-responsive transcriptional regulator)